MSSKSKVEEISKGEYDEPEVEERLEDLDTSRVPPDASAVMAIDDDSQRPTPPDSEIYERRESRPDEEFNKRLLAKAAMAADLKAETKRPTFMEDDSQRPTPPDSEAYESRPDDEFNKRLLAKAAMAVDSKEENTRPPVIDVDSQSKPFDSTNVGDEASKKSSSAPQPQPNADGEFNRKPLSKAATAVASKGENMRPPVMEDSQRPEPGSDSDSEYVTFESRPDDEFNRRLLAKAAMSADLKGETTRPPVMEDDSSLLRSYNSTNCGDDGSKKIAAAPQPPTQDVMEKIEEENDAALRPFNSSELEDESKLKIGLAKRKESTDEEVGQLPKIQNYHQYLRSETQTQRTAACSASVDDNEAIGLNPFFQQTIDAEKYMSVGPVVEAYLVEDKGEGDVGHITVYEATPLEPELPWWKQRRSKVFMVINCVLIIALAIGLGVSFSLSRHDNTATTTQLAENHDESSSSDESALVRSSGSSSSSSSKDA